MRRLTITIQDDDAARLLRWMDAATEDGELVEPFNVQNDEAPEPARKGCGDFIRVPGTNGGGMACGAWLTDLDGNRSQHFCPACAVEAKA